MARTLGRFLADAGEPVICIAGRDPARVNEAAAFVGSAVSPVLYGSLPSSVSHVLIAVNDSAVTAVADAIAERASPLVALHTSGVAGPAVLQPLRSKGTACGTLHPLQTVTGDAASVRALRGANFGLCGDSEALGWADHIVRLAHGTALHLKAECMALYHAAAVMASNSVLALVDASETMLQMAGLEGPVALSAIAPLLRASVENAFRLGPVAALTGPVARGDVATITAHLQALATAPERVRDLYRSAALQAVNMARRQGLASGKAEALNDVLRS